EEVVRGAGLPDFSHLAQRSVDIDRGDKGRVEDGGWPLTVDHVPAFEALRQRYSRLSHIARQFAQGEGRRLGVQPGCERLHDGRSHPARKPRVRLEYPVPHVSLIAAEELVAAVAGQQMVDTVALGNPSAAESRDGRGVSERLVVSGRDLRNQ